MEDLLRLFMAYQVPRTAIDPSLMRELSSMGRFIRTVKGENLHITLDFMGDTSSTEVPGILYRMEDALEGLEGFEYDLRGLGVFPDRFRPRVFWCGIDDGGRSQDMHVRLTGSRTSGKRDCFRPHLTLARVRDGRDVASLMSILDDRKDAFIGHCSCHEVLLLSSKLGPGGPVYETQGKVRLL